MINFRPNLGLLLSIASGGSLLANLTAAIKPRYRISNAKTGQTILEPDGIESFTYDGQSVISSAPIEHGSFTSFNKVQRPSSLEMVLLINSLTGLNASIPDITQFSFGNQRDKLFDLDDMKSGTELFNIETPKVLFSRYALVNYDFSTSASSGVQLLRIYARFEQVLEIAEVTISNPATESKPTDNDTSASTSAVTEPVQASTQSPATSVVSAGADGINKLLNTATGVIGNVTSNLPSALNTVKQPFDIVTQGVQVASTLNASTLTGLIA